MAGGKWENENTEKTTPQSLDPLDENNIVYQDGKLFQLQRVTNNFAAMREVYDN